MQGFPTQQALRLYFENPVGRLLEHPDGYAVVKYHSGKRKLNELQAFLTHAGRLLQARGWHRLFSDQQLMSAFTDGERTWIIDYWLSRTNQGSLIYGAVLVPHDVFARLSLNLIMNDAQESSLTYHLFDNEIDAKVWLSKQPK